MSDPYRITNLQMRQVADSLESTVAQCVSALQIVQEALIGISREIGVLRQLARLAQDSAEE